MIESLPTCQRVFTLFEHKDKPITLSILNFVRILLCFQEKMMVQEDPIELEKMMA